MHDAGKLERIEQAQRFLGHGVVSVYGAQA
jgi:hypothetical protein